MRPVLVFVALAVLASTAAGCGGGGSDGDELGSVTANDLAIMVLPAAVIGSAAEGLDVDPESGIQDAEATAEDTLDPDDTAADIEAAGFVAGYELSYTGGLEDGDVTSQVAMFDSPEQASAFVDETVKGVEDYEGEEVVAGVKLTSVDIEELDGPGDNAVRGTATVDFGGTGITSSVIAFTMGPVAAQVSVTRTTDAGEADLEALAQTLEERIRAVAAGEVSETPVQIPADEPQETTTADEENPVLEQVVLALEDLPAGVKIEKDGYVKDGDDVSFERDFDLGTAKIGSSSLIGLSSNAERMDSAAEAALTVGAIASFVEGPDGSDLFTNAFGQEAGFEPDSVKIRTIPAPGIGDRTTALHGRFDTRVGSFEAVFVFIANGRAAGQIYAMGAKGKVDQDDVLDLARKMAERMDAGR